MEVINDKLKDIEHMIPYKFHFDFGFHNTIKETYQHKSHYYDERPRDMDYKHEEYEIYDYMTGVSTFGNGFADGYMESEKWKLFPTLELIVKYKHIIFKDGRKYIVGKGAGRIEITDIISLFRFLQITKNYAIFNNLLNVMLIFIIDYNAEILNGKRVPSINLIDKYINKYYRWLYKERDNQIILVNSFIYEIEKKDIDYYSVAFNKKVIDYIASNWDKSFDDLLKHFTQQRSSSLSPDKETQLSIKKRINIIKTLLEKLEYNMEIGHKLIMSLQYQFIMDNIDDFPALKLDFQSKKLIFTSNKHMNEISDVFEGTYEKDSSPPFTTDEMNIEIQKELYTWLKDVPYSGKKDAEKAFVRYVEASNKYQRYSIYELYRDHHDLAYPLEEAYKKYVMVVSTYVNPDELDSILNKWSRGIHKPYYTDLSEGSHYTFPRLRLENARKQELLKYESDMKTRITARQPISGGSLFFASLMLIIIGFNIRRLLGNQVEIAIIRKYAGSTDFKTKYTTDTGRAYIYPTLLTIANKITEARLDKEKNIHTVNIYCDMSAFTQDKLYISYHIGHKKPHNSNIILLNQLILFSNKHILKEFYLKIKNKVDSYPKVSSPKVSSKSSSSFGSIGFPPKGGKQKKKSNT
jgi:hypothetical protein